jgi:hypothetical protein
METFIGFFVGGVGFSVGVLTGATLCQMATRKGRQEAGVEHRQMIELLERKCIGIERLGEIFDRMSRQRD